MSSFWVQHTWCQTRALTHRQYDFNLCLWSKRHRLHMEPCCLHGFVSSSKLKVRKQALRPAMRSCHLHNFESVLELELWPLPPRSRLLLPQCLLLHPRLLSLTFLSVIRYQTAITIPQRLYVSTMYALPLVIGKIPTTVVMTLRR